MLVDEQIARLEQLRMRIAAMTQTLGERELTGRALRLTLETEKRQAGSTKTDAERDAKVDPRYLAHVKKDLELSFEREIALAQAEALRLQIELQLAALRRTELIA
jgi:hypothetical protein